jgi:death-on-curing protein
MREPVWILEDVVEAIHERQLAEHGGTSGVRDAGALASALARPRQRFASGDATGLPQLAAAYAFGIARNHPFVDGNKRTALVAALLFLRLNGLALAASEEDTYGAFVALAAGDTDEDGLARWLEAHSPKA